MARPALVTGVVVFAIAVAFRLPDLGATCNVDAVLYWFSRTRQFWTLLAEGRFSEMYFSPHPGVSVMWLSGASMHAAGILNAPITERSVVAATAPLAIVASATCGLTVPLLFRVLTASGPSAARGARTHVGEALARRPALFAAGLTGGLLATEPFLVAHARTFHIDATATGFVWLACLFGILVLVERRVPWAIAAGVCFGIGLLTRMLSGTFLVGLGVAFAVLFAFECPRPRRLLGLYLVIGAAALATAFLLWPALLTSPGDTISRIVRGTGSTVGRGHRVFSWGEIHTRDPGLAFYGGAVLTRLSPEVLCFGLVGLVLAWRLPRRTLVVLAALACAYVPPAAGLLMSAKKGDRYPLLFFPLITLLASVCFVQLLERVPPRERFAGRTTLIAASLLALLFGVRASRLWTIHPMPIAWCAPYPGLRCEEVITLGNGEGFRDAALWIKANSPVENPSILAAYAGGAVLAPWLRFKRVRDGAQAHFVVTYLASDQRGNDPKTREYAIGEPVHEVRFQDRTYVRIFLGPKHPDRQRSKHRGRRD